MKKIFTITHWKRFSGLRIPILILGICSFLQVQSLNANNFLQDDEKAISGVITDANTGEALPGVSILIKGTSTGSITDVDGKFTLNAKSSDVLVFSYIGFLSEEIAVGNQTEINVSLAPDIIGLDEIVVIGYGVQKKKLNTGANLNVKGEDIQALNTSSSMEALKGLTPGVSITQNNGVPGAGNKIFIRGIGTTGNYEPLYIVDGIAVGDIDNLSPSDIESIDILKDAASAAIYGSRAANGVVLVTTKQGSRGEKTTVSYSGYFGIQNVVNPPELLNAQEYASAVNEASLNDDFGEVDFTGVPYWDQIESGEYQGTNWYKEIENPNAPVQNHSLNITGGSEVSTYSMGASYFEQEGVLGKQANHTYKRLNLRLNSSHVLWESQGRNIVVFGQNLTYINEKNPTLRTGNIYWNDLHNMLVASPLLPMYAPVDSINDPAYPYHWAIDFNRQEGNPIASMENQSKWNTNNNNTILGNVYLEIQPIQGLTLRSAFGINNWYSSNRRWTPSYNLSLVSANEFDEVNQEMYQGFTWTTTNTATYNFDIQDQHNFTILIGQEAQKNSRSLEMKGNNQNSVFNDPEYGYLDNFPTLDASNAALASFGGRDSYGWGLVSYFGRLSYDFRERYLLTAVIRADGSSNFDKGKRWGYFPSVSAGWIITNESFMENTRNWLSFAKMRFSWGQNGNQDLKRSFQYLANISIEGQNYYFGQNRDITTTGSTPSRIPNPNVSWETSEQLDIGLDMNFINNQLQFAFDWYQKDTKDWLVLPPSTVMDGTEPSYVNGGLVRNTGIELMLRYTGHAGDFNWGISGTFAYNKNNMVELPSSDSILHGPENVLSQGTPEMFRCEAGYPIGYFWGHRTAGIFQTDEEAAAWNATGSDYGGEYYFNPNNLQAGDVIFVDENQDGAIDELDRVMIGNPHPDVIVGLQFNCDYKGFSLQLNGYGQFGQQVAKNYRSVDNYLHNYTKEVYDARWHGPGTSNRQPRLVVGGHNNYQFISDIFIEDGDFFRISNLTIGYDFVELFKNAPVQQLKLYVSVKNLYNFTKYPGMDPEVGYSPTDDNDPDYDFPWGSGMDLGLYPQSRTWMVGLNVTF